jgi:hypothetical protein
MQGQPPRLVTITVNPDGRSYIKGTPLPTMVLREGEEKRCYDEWNNPYLPKFLSFIDNRPLTTVNMATGTFTEKLYYRTTRSLGPGSTYFECDGVTRFTFTGPEGPTVTATSISDVTVTRSFFGIMSVVMSIPNITVTQPTKPTCRIPGRICGAYAELQSILFWHGSNLPKADFFFFFMACGDKTISTCDVEIDDEIVLFFWPEETKQRNICAATWERATPLNPMSTLVTSNIEFRGPDVQLLSSSVRGTAYPGPKALNTPFILSGTWTFTSPTLYVAHRPMTANILFESITFGDGGFTTVKASTNPITFRPSGVFGVKETDLTLLHPVHRNSYVKNGVEYARQVANGEFQPMMTSRWPFDLYTTPVRARPFNPLDIQEPIPASMYFDGKNEECWGIQSHCRTITADNYRPHIAINRKAFLSLLPKSASGLAYNSVNWQCTIPTLIDPPIALRPISSRRRSSESMKKSPSQEVPVTQTTPVSGTKPSSQGSQAPRGCWMEESNLWHAFRPPDAQPGSFIIHAQPAQTAEGTSEQRPENSKFSPDSDQADAIDAQDEKWISVSWIDE